MQKSVGNERQEPAQELSEVLKTMNDLVIMKETLQTFNISSKFSLEEVELKQIDMDWNERREQDEDGLEGMPKMLHPCIMEEVNRRANWDTSQKEEIKCELGWLLETKHEERHGERILAASDNQSPQKILTGQKQEFALQNKNLTEFSSGSVDEPNNQTQMSQLNRAKRRLNANVEAFRSQVGRPIEPAQSAPEEKESAESGMGLPIQLEEARPEPCVKLRQLSMELCRVLGEHPEGLLQKDAVDAIIQLNSRGQTIVKSLKRRIYDCINVMLSCDAIIKEGNMIRLATSDIKRNMVLKKGQAVMGWVMENSIMVIQHRIVNKKQKLNSLLSANEAFQKLRARNKELGPGRVRKNVIWLPSIIIQATLLKESCKNMKKTPTQLVLPLYSRFIINFESAAIKCLNNLRHLETDYIPSLAFNKNIAKIHRSELNFVMSCRKLGRNVDLRQVWQTYLSNYAKEVDGMENDFMKQQVKQEQQVVKEQRLWDSKRSLKRFHADSKNSKSKKSVEPKTRKPESNSQTNFKSLKQTEQVEPKTNKPISKYHTDSKDNKTAQKDHIEPRNIILELRNITDPKSRKSKEHVQPKSIKTKSPKK